MADEESFEEIRKKAEAVRREQREKQSQADAARKQQLVKACHRASTILNAIADQLEQAKSAFMIGSWEKLERKGDPLKDTQFAQCHAGHHWAVSDRQYDMSGRVELTDNGQTLTVFIGCSATGGRAKGDEVIADVRVNDQMDPMPIADADDESIRKWFHGKLGEYISACVQASG